MTNPAIPVIPNIPNPMNKRERSFGTHAAARICQVSPTTIIRWIEGGHLPSFATLGGHRRVRQADLLAFLRERKLPIPDEMRPARPTQVLVVDDEPQVLRVIRRTLAKIDPKIEVHEALDGFEAGSKAAQLVPDVVVLDLKLPGIDGLKVCRMIRSDPRLKGMKILAISGQDPAEFESRSLKAGADYFLAKPFTVQEFKENFVRVLGGS